MKIDFCLLLGLLALFYGLADCKSVRLEHCSSQELEEIHLNHTRCFLERLKNDSSVVDKIRQNYNDDKTIVVDFKRVCSGVQSIVDECGAIYRKCFVKDLIRFILPLQTSFFEEYLGEGEDTCSTGEKEDPYDLEVTEKCNEDQLKTLDKRVGECSDGVESLTDKKLDALAENLELDSMFDLLCDNVDKIVTECGEMFHECYNKVEVEAIKQLIRQSLRTPLTVVAATLEDTFFVELPEELRGWNFDRQRCSAFTTTASN